MSKGPTFAANPVSEQLPPLHARPRGNAHWWQRACRGGRSQNGGPPSVTRLFQPGVLRRHALSRRSAQLIGVQPRQREGREVFQAALRDSFHLPQRLEHSLGERNWKMPKRGAASTPATARSWRTGCGRARRRSTSICAARSGSWRASSSPTRLSARGPCSFPGWREDAEAVKGYDVANPTVHARRWKRWEHAVNVGGYVTSQENRRLRSSG